MHKMLRVIISHRGFMCLNSRLENLSDSLHVACKTYQCVERRFGGRSLVAGKSHVEDREGRMKRKTKSICARSEGNRRVL